MSSRNLNQEPIILRGLITPEKDPEDDIPPLLYLLEYLVTIFECAEDETTRLMQTALFFNRRPSLRSLIWTRDMMDFHPLIFCPSDELISAFDPRPDDPFSLFPGIDNSEIDKSYKGRRIVTADGAADEFVRGFGFPFRIEGSPIIVLGFEFSHSYFPGCFFIYENQGCLLGNLSNKGFQEIYAALDSARDQITDETSQSCHEKSESVPASVDG